jgi:hypothetical protein
MRVIEILNFNKELLNRMHDTGIRLNDCRYIDLYNEYQTLQMQGEKMTYIVAVLSEKYSVSERKVYDLVKRFNGNCKSFTVK